MLINNKRFYMSFTCKIVFAAASNNTTTLTPTLAPIIDNNTTPYDGKRYDGTLRHLYRVIDDKKALNKSEIKYILFWDKFYENDTMNLGLGSDIFQRCPINSCVTTNNHSYMQVEDFDAIIFHSGRWDSSRDGVPKKRSWDQKYVFYSWESPYNTYFDETYVKDFYNWTLNYRRDSDIHFPYGMFYKRNAKCQQFKADSLRTKSKLAMWMVSNCVTDGVERRERYVYGLKKYIDVDVYGKCGTLQCGSDENCRKIMEDNYFFYLAFENTQTLDYVTEKMFYTLKYNVIPVVFGNANYENIAPKKSVIDIKDVSTPKLLAEFLIRLSSNLSEYLEYFEWKRKYDVGDSREYALCQLCEMLHRPLEYRSYSNIMEWYFGYNSYLK